VAAIYTAYTYINPNQTTYGHAYAYTNGYSYASSRYAHADAIADDWRRHAHTYTHQPA
jgi:hypothetical protein